MRNREKNEKAGAGHGLIEASGQPVPEPAGRCPLSRIHGAATARNRGAGARSRTLTGALTDGKPLQCVLSEPEREPWNTKSNRPQPSPSNPSPKPRRRTATPPRSTSDPSAATRAAPTCGRPCAASSGSQRGVRATMSNASRGLPTRGGAPVRPRRHEERSGTRGDREEARRGCARRGVSGRPPARWRKRSSSRTTPARARVRAGACGRTAQPRVQGVAGGSSEAAGRPPATFASSFSRNARYAGSPICPAVPSIAFSLLAGQVRHVARYRVELRRVSVRARHDPGVRRLVLRVQVTNLRQHLGPRRIDAPRQEPHGSGRDPRCREHRSHDRHHQPGNRQGQGSPPSSSSRWRTAAAGARVQLGR